MKKERDSGIELLRILAILLVIGVHAFSYGEFNDLADEIGGHVASTALLMKLAVRPAVNIFVIITGYFMIHAPFDLNKNMRRVGKTYQKMLLYSIVLTLIFLPLGPSFWVTRGKSYELWQVILKGLFPVTSQTWYFLTDYLLLCLLIPFVNLALQRLNQKQFRALVIGLVLFMSVWMSLVHVKPFKLVFESFGYGEMVRGKEVFHFLFIYVLGAYIGRFSQPRAKPNLLWLLGAFLSLFLNFVLCAKLPKSGWPDVAIHYANPFIVAEAVCLLMFFKDLHFHSRIVNALSATTLGVYAITEFRWVRTVLWKAINFKYFDNSSVFGNLLHAVLVLGGVFLAAAAVDLLVSWLLARLQAAVRERKLKKVKQSS